jgi:hypothetical protein
MAQTIKIRTSYAETVSKDYQSNRYGLDLECDVQLNGGDHRQEVESAAATLFAFSKAIVAKQKESGLAVNDLFNSHAPLPQPESQPHQNGNGNGNGYGNGGNASGKQIGYIRNLCKRTGQVAEELARDLFKKSNLEALTAREASTIIEGLKGGK